MLRYLIILIILILTVDFSFGFIENANFYGYSQIDYSISNKEHNQSDFSITRLNLLGDFQIGNKSRFFLDLEFEDNVDIRDNYLVGNIKFSQIWAEYSFFKELNVRAGKMLTNFGIYNKIHDASPTYFSINPPLIYGKFDPTMDFSTKQRYFGKYIMGIEATGTLDLDKTGSQLEYSLLYGKGRFESIDTLYIQNNNAFAGRIFVTPSFIQGLQIGGSIYADYNELGMGGVSNELEIIPAFEIQYEYSDLQIQAELFLPSFKKQSGKTQNSLLTYMNFAYTLYDVLTPYTQIAYISFDTNEKYYQTQFLIGLNYAITPNFYFKNEVQYLFKDSWRKNSEFGTFKSSLSIAF